MNSLLRWLRSWRRVWRYRSRKRDIQFLFPVVWAESGCDPVRFIKAISLHTALDPNWRGHEDEWRLTPADPGTWVARRMLAEASSRV